MRPPDARPRRPMARWLAPAAAIAAVAAAVVATSTTAPRRERSPALASRPSAASVEGAGLAAAAAWLEATGRPARVVSPGEAPPGAGEVWLLLAPAAPLPPEDARAFLDHAAAGGLAIWALGGAPQPALERALGAVQLRGLGERTVAGRPGHPLLDGLALRSGPSGVTASAPGALPLTGPDGPPLALAIPVGRGEVVVLAGPEPLDNAHVAEADALSLWVRLASRGPVAFDERWLLPATAPLRAPLLAGGQALLAAAVLLLALGRRHGAVRPPPPPGGRRTARDYLASLAALSRRAGAEAGLAAGSWRRLRLALEREAGVPSGLPAAEAARRLERRDPGAAAALLAGEAAAANPGQGQLLAVTRAAAAVEAALRRPPGAFDSARGRR